ncbi:MAG: RHS repeat protein, partial [Candidatus Marinimicrobia bacterium]|nr:RHS repeat protein [Candidatus Neomarinimicrobiota bacterium]
MQQTSSTGVTTTYAYDALRRQVGVFSESAGGTRSVASVTAYNHLGQVESVTDAADNVTLYLYDAATGRRISTLDPLGQATHTAYDLPGRVIATWGATYPVAYEYDPHGRMTARYTLRDGAVETNFTDYAALAAILSAFDKTAWHYDLATGLLTIKVYADGHGTAYTYTHDGQLVTRTWARGIATEYA